MKFDVRVLRDFVGVLDSIGNLRARNMLEPDEFENVKAFTKAQLADYMNKVIETESQAAEEAAKRAEKSDNSDSRKPGKKNPSSK